MSEIIIDKNAKQITFTNNGIGFSQFGVANEILDLIENQTEEIERLNNIINEFKDWLERKKQFYDTDEEEAIDYYFLYGDVLNQFKGLLGESKGSDKEWI